MRRRPPWTSSGALPRCVGSLTSCDHIWSLSFDQTKYHQHCRVREAASSENEPDSKEDFNLLLTKYAIERVLYRISQSPYKDIFVLKGALLFELWTEQTHRPTRDADFLSQGDNSLERFQKIFEEICAMTVHDDGLRLDPASVRVDRIKEDQDYEGIRVTYVGYLEASRLPVQIDIGFGDTITPEPVQTSFPTLLENPAPVLLAYPRETVVAEKFEALVKLGLANTRMKDFHDLKTWPASFRLLDRHFLRLYGALSNNERHHYPLKRCQPLSRLRSTATVPSRCNGMHSFRRTSSTLNRSLSKR